MPTRGETTVSSENWAVYCKPTCTESQRKGIQSILSQATEEEGLTMVEQDRVRTLVRMSKARKYDAAQAFLQNKLKKFPGTGKEGLWTLQAASVSVDAHRDAQSSPTAAPKIDPPSFQSAPALALKCALLASGAHGGAPASLYTVKERIGKGTYGKVWAAVGPDQAALAIKSCKDRWEALVEVTAYSSLPPHPNVLQLLDVMALSNDKLGLVFPLYMQNLQQFAEQRQVGCRPGDLKQAFELEELLHCAMCLGRALEHVHAHQLTHTDLKPDNILVKDTGLAKVPPKDLVKLQMVIADFGMAQLSDPELRVCPSSREMEQKGIHICTLPYRAPELLLGDRLFGCSVDLWSLGCVLGELCCGNPLFAAANEIDVLFQAFQLLGTPGAGYITGLPQYASNFPKFPKAAWPPAGVPAELSTILQQCLELDPKSRISASGVCTTIMDFARMKVIVDRREGGQGSATILEQRIEPRLLTFLQEDPDLLKVVKKRKGKTGVRQCLKKQEMQAGLKYEEGGHITLTPPVCTRMATLDMSQPTCCKRVGMFARAFIKRNRPQFLQMGQEIATSIRKFPEHLQQNENAQAFLQDILADACLVYSVVQVMRPSERADPPHFDGGASLLHSGLTLYGSRDLALLYPDGEVELLAQMPGKYYIGNLCAIKHEVRHHDPRGQNLLKGHEIAVMFRTDCFRGSRARKLVGKPAPIHIYDTVNEVVATALARDPFHLPTYAEVMAEAPPMELSAPGRSLAFEVPLDELPASKRRKS